MDILFLFICGLSSLFVWTFANSFTTLLIFIVIYGFMSGAVFSLRNIHIPFDVFFFHLLIKRFLFLVAPITAAITGMEKYPSGVCLYLFFMTAARFGPSFAGAIQTATDKHSFFSQQMVTGLAFILSAFVTVILKYKMEPKMFAKI